MQQAWDAAVAAWQKFIAELANGEMIARGMYLVSGIRTEIDPVEWSRAELVLDVRNGDLIEGWYGRPPGKHTVRWSAITLRAANQPRQKKGREHGYDWERAWNYATTLRAETQWNWDEHRRDKKQPLPAVHKTVEDKIEAMVRVARQCSRYRRHSPEHCGSALCGQAHAGQAQAMKSALVAGRSHYQPP